MSSPARLPANSLESSAASFEPAEAEAASDLQLVQQVLAGDRAPFEQIMRRYNQRLFRVARSIIGEDAEAEDIVQETYLRAYRHLGRFAGRARFSTWLTRIAVHEALGRRRKRQRLRLIGAHDVEIAAMETPPRTYDATSDADRLELSKVLADAIDGLPLELRIVVTLRMVQRLSTLRTADCLKLSPANVKIRLHRARKLLRTSIDHRIGAEARRLYAFDGARCDRIVTSVLARLSSADA